MAKRLALDKNGNLTYCTASEENIGKGRCNHITHQSDLETPQNFITRIADEMNSKISMSNIPTEIRHLNNGLFELDAILKEKGINLTIESVGGYATYHITDLPTMDIDSFKRLDTGIKQLVRDIAENSAELQIDWLNDDVLNLQSFGGPMTQRLIHHVSKHESECFVEDERLPGLESIKLMRAKPEVVMCFKIAAMHERNKEKDWDDISRIIKHEKWSPNEIWNYCKNFGLSRFMEKEDLAVDLYQIGALNDSEYMNFVNS